MRTRIATSVEVAAAFAVSTVTLRRWCVLLETGGVGGLVRERPGPRGPSKLTDALRAQIVGWDGEGMTFHTQGAARAGVSTATVRVALGRVEPRRASVPSLGGIDAAADEDAAVIDVLADEPDRCDEPGEPLVAMRRRPNSGSWCRWRDRSRAPPNGKRRAAGS